MLLNTRLKKIYNFLVLDFVDSFANFSSQIIPNTLLLIRFDAIGDYVLFRNFIEILRKSKQYKNYKITLCGNILWKDITENFDKKYIDEFIWIDRKKFYNNIFYRFSVLKNIGSRGFEIAINPTYSRDYYYDDLLIKTSNAAERIGSTGDASNLTAYQRNKSNKYYTKLINSSPDNLFEFNRNKEYFENLLKEEININLHSIKLENFKNKLNFNGEDYVVFCPGASWDFKRWDINNYKKIVNYIQTKYAYKIVLVGGKEDIHLAQKLIYQTNSENIIDLTGKISLVDLAELLSKAKLLISNDTASVHIGMAVNTKVITIANGNHFGRFTQYPEEYSDRFECIYPDEIMKNLSNTDYLYKKFHAISNLDINSIKVEDVQKIVDKFLN